MSKHERKPVLELPLRVVVTEEGRAAFLRRNQKLTKFERADGGAEYGLLLDKFAPASVQRLLIVGCVSKIEISRTEFDSCRQEVLDLSKLIVYGLLYRQFDAALFQALLSIDAVKRRIEADPGRIESVAMRNFLRENEGAAADIRAEILAPMREAVLKNSNLLPGEVKAQLFLSEKFLRSLRPGAWFILSEFRGADGYDALLREVRSNLSEYMEKSRIAEYVALMTMELASNAERTALRREVRGFALIGAEPNAAAFDPALRKKAMAELEKRGESVILSWNIGGRGEAAGSRGNLQVRLAYRGRDDRGSAGASEMETLADFYKGTAAADAELGLYYLSYLNESCAKVGVEFESVAERGADSENAAFALSFNL